MISHLYSLSVLNLILGWGGELKIIKFLSLIILCLMFLFVTIRYNTRASSLFFKLTIVPLFSLLFVEAPIQDVLIEISDGYFFPIAIGFLSYSIFKYVDVSIFKRYLSVWLVASTVFAILQGVFGIYTINKLLFFSPFLDRIMLGNMPLGLASSPMYFGAQLILITPFIINDGKLKMALSSVFLLFTGQRGAFLSLIGIYVGRNFTNRRYLLLFILLFFLSISSIFLYLLNIQFGRSYDLDRLFLWVLGVKGILLEPFGYGSVLHFLQSMEETTITLKGFEHNVKLLWVHNNILTALLMFGLPAGLYIIQLIFRSIDASYYSGKVLFASIFVAMFHNVGFLYGDVLFHIFLGIHILEVKSRYDYAV